MDGNSGILKIPILTGENFYSWKQKIRLVLSYRELDEIISPDHKIPTEPREATEWSNKDRKSMAIIGLTLPDDHLHHIDGITSAAKMWRSLLDIFERKTLLNQLTAR